MKIYQEDVFYAIFKPILLEKDQHKGSCFSVFATVQEALLFVPNQHDDAYDYIWSLINDHDSRNQYISSGIHFVNLEGFLVSSKSCKGQILEFEISWDAISLSTSQLKSEIYDFKKNSL